MIFQGLGRESGGEWDGRVDKAHCDIQRGVVVFRRMSIAPWFELACGPVSAHPWSALWRRFVCQLCRVDATLEKDAKPGLLCSRLMPVGLIIHPRLAERPQKGHCARDGKSVVRKSVVACLVPTRSGSRHISLARSALCFKSNGRQTHGRLVNADHPRF